MKEEIKHFDFSQSVTEDVSPSGDTVSLRPSAQELDPPTILDKQQIKELALIEAGVTRKALYDRLFDGINAVKSRVDVNDEGDQVVVKEPDMVVRHKYIETALRVIGDLKPDSLVDNSKTFNLNVNDRQKMVTRLRNILEVLPDGG